MFYSEASDRCQAEKRKTINGEDILFAISTLGLDNYVEPLKLYLQKYREVMKGERQIESELSGMGGDVMTAQKSDPKNIKTPDTNIHIRLKVKLCLSKDYQEISDLELIKNTP